MYLLYKQHQSCPSTAFLNSQLESQLCFLNDILKIQVEVKTGTKPHKKDFHTQKQYERRSTFSMISNASTGQK